MSMAYERQGYQKQKGPRVEHSRFITGVVAAAVLAGALQLAVVETYQDIKSFFLGRDNKPKRF